MADNLVRAVAFYLPQFYPIPENDEWWGKGFTEWTNVAKAKPLFPNHYQPRLPADLGFYDLRVPETRAAQAQLARDYGIEGFCYWHYWFNGRRILERPFEEVLNSGEPDFPFCLGWANHTWSRRWSGEEKNILIQQTYSAEDDIQHAVWLTKPFADSRYIHVHGRPLLVVYNPYHLPEPRRTTDTIRDVAVKAGLPEPYLVGINLANPEVDPRSLGFDGAINHQPQFRAIPRPLLHEGPSKKRVLRNLRYRIVDSRLKILDYMEAMTAIFSSKPTYPAWPCVVVDWDTTPRLGRSAIIFDGATPQAFEDCLKRIVHDQLVIPHEERFVFINAWNEWGEGMYLEPDTKFGKGYLEAVECVINKPSPEIQVD
jgi:hypothetical protein